MTRPSGTPETPRGRKGWKQNSNGKPNNWATNWSPSNPRLHNEPVQRGSSLEVSGSRDAECGLPGGRTSKFQNPAKLGKLCTLIAHYFSGGRECLLQRLGCDSVSWWRRSSFSVRAARRRLFRVLPTTAIGT